MSKLGKIPAYQGNTRSPKDVVQKEIRELGEKLHRSERKRRKWKQHYHNKSEYCTNLKKALAETKGELIRAQKALAYERDESNRRVLHTKIQAHLDALNFYREGSEDGV